MLLYIKTAGFRLTPDVTWCNSVEDLKKALSLNVVSLFWTDQSSLWLS